MEVVTRDKESKHTRHFGTARQLKSALKTCHFKPLADNFVWYNCWSEALLSHTLRFLIQPSKGECKISVLISAQLAYSLS